jgi:hypothetical protein
VELNDRDTTGIVWKAFEDVAKRAPGKPLNANEVLKAADHHAAAFFRQTPNKYILVASLSIKAFPSKKIAIRGCEITPLSRRDPRYRLPKVLGSAQHRNHFADHLKSNRYQLVKVATAGRTMFESKRQTTLRTLRDSIGSTCRISRHGAKCQTTASAQCALFSHCAIPFSCSPFEFSRFPCGKIGVQRRVCRACRSRKPAEPCGA